MGEGGRCVLVGGKGGGMRHLNAVFLFQTPLEIVPCLLQYLWGFPTA